MISVFVEALVNILAVGAHWDDIELTCCLTLKMLWERGHRIYCAVLCQAQYADGQHTGPSEEEAHRQGMEAFRAFGAEYVETSKGENGRLAYSKEAMQELESAAERFRIDTVFTHWHGDVNTDHQAVWELSRTAFRRVKNLLLYQSNSYVDHVNVFVPNCFYGFSEQDYALKRQILAGYRGEWEYRKRRWEWEIFEREKAWGNRYGYEYAEGFHLCRVVNSCFCSPDTGAQG